MSYYSSNENIRPGPINGSALDGLCTRVAISVKRVLDSCCKQQSLEGTTLNLTNMNDGGPPYTFVSATSTQVAAIVSDLSVTRLEERPCFARVRCTVTVPLKVTYTDVNNTTCVCDSEISVPEDVVMYVPEASVFPFEIEAAASCNCATGRFTGPTTVYCTACLTIILKIVAETDLLVPAYGYCPTPRAVDFEEQVCNRFFELPLYPSGR